MMAPRPTGTLTFLYTDIVGSTKLARDYPGAWPEILARHDALLQGAITGHNGHIFRTVGDEFNAAFEMPLDALAAAVAAQIALHREAWGEAGALRVRMALHSGPATRRGSGYEAYLTLSHAKRLVSAACGGQILLSEATEALLREQLPAGVSLRDLGRHRLKDFEQAEHIFQVVTPDLPAEFPPLTSLDVTPNNLPAKLTSFVGRAKELGDVRQLLSEERLLTLTGPGGSGKTRLALQAAAEMMAHFPDGVFFVALAPISDSGLVASTIAQTLGITESPRRPIFERLKEHLRTKSLLLVLDNFEQVIAAAPRVAELLVTCPELKLLVTSREALHLSGEREYPVPPLPLPDLSEPPSPESLAHYAAVELFIQRANAVRPDFRITEDTAPAIAEICYRLDGLPLAIELAAARIKLLPPRAMLARLEKRLDFLTGGARDKPARQQTLRDTIAWSYDLLTEEEQRLFRRLSVFVGGFTVHAAEAVAGDHPADGSVLDSLGSLLDKSLLLAAEGANDEPRFAMLATLREFGLEQLAASGEQKTIQERHARFFLALAEQAEARLESAGQVEWMNGMEQEHDNLRAALEWSKTAAGAAEICWRLAGALGSFWEVRGHYSEGRERLAAILAKDAAQGRTAARARLLARAAELAYRQSDYAATISFAEECLAIYREVGNKQGMASALIKLGNAATEMGDYDAASRFLEEALTIWRELEDKHGTARALISLGWAALRPGDYPLAEARLAEALAISRELGDTRSIGFELSGLGEVALRQDETVRATRLVEESLALRRQLGNKWGVGVSLGILGAIAIREGDWEGAMARLSESLDVRREIGDQSGCAWCLERLAEVAMAQEELGKAVRLFGAGAALRASISSVIDPVDQPEYESKIRSLRAALGEERFAALWDEGQALTLEQAAAYALERES
ncbi:MAG: adenylate/guanylate cyclase domain-containing protein [Chloroflexi bacterium]|nr:adenylate/guanylate cyclase domain-containing protein [Chloroflexota bacterium]